jgi:hypothetical protein
MRISKWLISFVVVLLTLLPGCDDDGSGPDLIEISDFQGSWESLSYQITDAANPALTMEIISMGAVMQWQADETGQFTGSAFIPAALAGQDMNLDVQGSFSLLSQDSVVIHFVPEYPPFLTETRAEFQLVGDLLSFQDQDSEFDFDGNGAQEPAVFEGRFQRG